jgi:hypothetical protein
METTQIAPHLPSSIPRAAETDYRLADFKFLLPLGPELRVLINHDIENCEFVPPLLADVGQIEVVAQPVNRAERQSRPGLPHHPRLKLVSRPTGQYDLIVSRTLMETEYLNDRGLLCLFDLQPQKQTGTHDLLSAGWMGSPSWPNFRYLIPDTRTGRSVAIRDLKISRFQLWKARLKVLVEKIVKNGYPSRGFQLFWRAKDCSRSTFQEQVGVAFNTHPQLSGMAALPRENWIIYSGQKGEGNPIIATVLNQTGKPWVVIKTSRFPEQSHLQEEEEKIWKVQQRLGPALASTMILPLAQANVLAHPLLVYPFVPTHRIPKWRWHLSSRRNCLVAVTQWLAGIARKTAERIPVSRFQEQHLFPLQRLLERQVLPPDLIEPAKRAIKEIEEHQEKPFSILEHGDFGIYNIRLSSKDGGKFRVLDWGSSEISGIPLGDLCTMLITTRAPLRLATRCLAAYLQEIGCPKNRAFSFWLSYMARRWEELDAVHHAPIEEGASGGCMLLEPARRVQTWLASL